MVLPGEAVADGGVESKAEGAEKGAVVDGAVVRIYDVVRGYDFECQIDVDGYLEVACQTVARAGGEDAEGCGGAAEAACGLVDGAVAAAGEHAVVAVVGGLARQACGVTSRAGKTHVDFVAAGSHGRDHLVGDAFLAACARNRVDYEHQLRHDS